MNKGITQIIAMVIALALFAGAQDTPKKKGGHKKPGGGSTATASGGFTLECKLPFDDIATKPDPFPQCGNCGVVSTKAPPAEVSAKAAQSHAKNDFCADTNAVTVVTVADLRDLQKQAAAKKLVTTDIPDRSKLQLSLNGKSIGEGSVVRLVAWVQDAHLSDCASGEEVNCETSGAAHNDIHIVLVDPTSGGRSQDECSSVTAEMSPHFRPAAWSELDKKIPTDNVIRVTGPLFFDNAHVPCQGLTRITSGKNADKAPFRSSLWEIHPAYQFEVCTNTDATKCDVNSSDASLWKPYDKWVKDPGIKTAVTTSHEGCVEPGKQKAGNVPAQCPLKK